MSDDRAMCIPPEAAPAPNPVSEILRALLDGGSVADRGEQRGHVESAALGIARRAHDLHAEELARVCYAIDAARFDCGELSAELERAHASVAQLPAAQRAQLQDPMGALDHAVSRLCAAGE